jgi:hypothetical protein
VCAPCRMHKCVISTMFGSCFWFFFKTFIFSNNRWSPPSPRSFAFPTLVFYPVDPLPPSPSHFPLWFFNPSSPPAPSFPSFTFPIAILYLLNPRPVLRISHSDSLTRRAPHPVLPVLHISHSGSLQALWYPKWGQNWYIGYPRYM